MAALPPVQIKVMRVILHEVEVTYANLCAAMDSLPSTERLSRAELDEVLQALIVQQWILFNNNHYKVNLAHKSSRTLSEFTPPRRKSGASLRGIWDSIEKSLQSRARKKIKKINHANTS